MTTEVEQQPQQQPVSLQINDIFMAAEAISIAMKRSAYQAEEIAEVFSLYERLTKFTAFIRANQPADAATPNNNPPPNVDEQSSVTTEEAVNDVEQTVTEG
jgi:hypothetical protein